MNNIRRPVLKNRNTTLTYPPCTHPCIQTGQHTYQIREPDKSAKQYQAEVRKTYDLERKNQLANICDDLAELVAVHRFFHGSVVGLLENLQTDADGHMRLGLSLFCEWLQERNQQILDELEQLVEREAKR